MHTYRHNDVTKLYEVIFELALEDYRPNVLASYRNAWDAAQMVNYLNGGEEPRLTVRAVLMGTPLPTAPMEGT